MGRVPYVRSPVEMVDDAFFSQARRSLGQSASKTKKTTKYALNTVTVNSLSRLHFV